MGDFGFSFDPNEVPEGDDEFGLIPDGWYEVMIDKAEMRETNDGKGRYLWLQERFTDGNASHVGRVVFDRLNVVNANETAVKIAKRTLADICRAVGISAVDDSQQLVGKVLLAKVKTRPARGEYDASNEVKAYRAVGDGKPKEKAAAGGSWM